MHGGRLVVMAVTLFCLAACAQASWPESGGSEAALAAVRVEAGYREYTGFVPTTTRDLAPREEGCSVDVVLDGRPDRGFEVIGLATAERSGQALIEEGGGEERAIEWLRAVACQVGGHVMFDLRTETSRGPYVGRAIRGRAVLAVYSDGAPAPAPAAAPAPSPAPATGAEPAPETPAEPTPGWGTPAADPGSSAGWGAPRSPDEEAADETF